jgi:hypothetical protein
MIECLRPGWPQVLLEPILDERKKTVSRPTDNSPSPVPPPAGLPAQQPEQVKIEDANALACYANFCRVTGTAEELILDFGLNPQMTTPSPEPIVIKQRIVTNLFTAKRLLQVLEMTIQRHEAAFGVLETDVQRRVRRT